MIGKAGNSSSWSALLDDCFLHSSGESFTEAELEELVARLGQERVALCWQHLLLETEKIH